MTEESAQNGGEFEADGGDEGGELSSSDLGSDGVVRRDRFSGGPARSFLSSLAADERIFAADLEVDRAHTVMLAEQGIIGDAVAGQILTALDAIEVDGHDSLPDGEDVHEAIETAVIERIGADGGKMHTARSRNDEVAACIRYRLREDVLEAIETTLALRESLVEVATEHTETIMPGYTHLQPAQPTTVAHWALAYEGAVRRDTERLLEAYGRINQSPLGGLRSPERRSVSTASAPLNYWASRGRRQFDGRRLEPRLPARDGAGAVDARDDAIGAGGGRDYLREPRLRRSGG